MPGRRQHKTTGTTDAQEADEDNQASALPARIRKLAALLRAATDAGERELADQHAHNLA